MTFRTLILYWSTCLILSLGGFVTAQSTEPWFDAGINYSVGGGEQNSVAVADLDGDGDSDLIIGTTKGIAVLANQGNGTFADPAHYLDDYKGYTVNLGDIDGDDDLDLIASADKIYILENNGVGAFALSGSYGAGSRPFDVCGCDLDGDGDCDLAVTNYSVDSVSVLINDGGMLVMAANYPVARQPRSIVAADFDQDGDNDLALASESWQGLSLLYNNGDGSFATAVNGSWGSYSWDLVADDFDGDGDIDLIVTHDELMPMENKGDGTFVSRWFPQGWDADGFLSSADIDADGDKDLVVGGRYTDRTSIILNNGNWWFDCIAGFSSSSPGSPNCLNDLDGDGSHDLVIANRGAGFVSVFQGYGHGAFSYAPSYLVGSFPSCVQAADFDRDGSNDLAVGTWGKLYILNNDGTGSFDAFSRYDNDLGNRLCVADFNSDGYEDIAVEYLPSNDLLILMNNCDGTFSQNGTCLVGDDILSIASADFDANGYPDLAVTAGHTYPEIVSIVSIFSNNGGGSFVQSDAFQTSGVPWYICCADFNSDDAPDLAVASDRTRSVSVFINSGGVFASAVDYNVGYGPRCVVTADFDNDGDTDLASLNQDFETISVLANNGDGTFAVKTVFSSTSGGFSICAGDYDNDGATDLALARGTIAILKGNGDATFELIQDFSAGQLPLALCASDLDGNGALDLAACNYASGTVSVLINKVASQTGIEYTTELETLPHGIVLKQNYPNPFNPNTEIVFALTTASHVNLTIFNIIGQKVATLLDGATGAGYHTVTWDGRNHTGEHVATGIYFCRLVADDFVASRKMLLVK